MVLTTNNNNKQNWDKKLLSTVPNPTAEKKLTEQKRNEKRTVGYDGKSQKGIIFSDEQSSRKTWGNGQLQCKIVSKNVQENIQNIGSIKFNHIVLMISWLVTLKFAACF